VPEPAPPATNPREPGDRLAPVRAGTPPMLGYRPADVYAAAAEWLAQMADQLDAEGEDGAAAAYWSPNLLYAPLYATVAAAAQGMDEPAIAAVVIMATAWFMLGDVVSFADPHNRGRTPPEGLTSYPRALTDPATPRADVIKILRESADELRHCHGITVGMDVAVQHFPHAFTTPTDTPEAPR